MQTNTNNPNPNQKAVSQSQSKLREARQKVNKLQSQNASNKSNSNNPPNIQIGEAVKNLLRRTSSVIKTKCIVCETHKPDSEFVTFTSSCGHRFCSSCTDTYLSYRILVNDIPIPCLVEECVQKFSESSPLFAGLPDTLKTKYKKFVDSAAILNNPFLKHCPTPDCEGVLNIEIVPLKCQKCGKAFCKGCLLPTHGGECDNFADQFLRDNYNFKKCPKCKMLIEKSQGCIHMTCRCTHQFCYECGADWSAAHNCFENAYLTTPVTPCQRVLNYMFLPFWAVIGFCLLLAWILFILALALVVGPIVIGFQTFQCLGELLSLIFTVAFFPVFAIVVLVALFSTFDHQVWGIGLYWSSLKYLAR